MEIYKLTFSHHNVNKNLYDSRCVGVYFSLENLLSSITLESLSKVGVRYPDKHIEQIKDSIKKEVPYRLTNFYPSVIITEVRVEKGILDKLD